MEDLDSSELDFILMWFARFLYFVTFLLLFAHLVYFIREGVWIRGDFHWLFYALFQSAPFRSPIVSLQGYLDILWDCPVWLFTLIIGVFCSLFAKKM
ncbi:MAG: hypothetical protein LBR29_09415 [Methylobacteriaceae bacterium]|jgi:hypothetical protein|nr:hypothetical protein [Methylobacteriaceae bacterium]